MQFLAICRCAVVWLVLVIANSSKLSESSSSLQRIYPSPCRNIRHPMFSDELTVNFCELVLCTLLCADISGFLPSACFPSFSPISPWSCCSDGSWSVRRTTTLRHVAGLLRGVYHQPSGSRLRRRPPGN